MPIIISVYGCLWKGCGFYKKNRESVKRHEKTCFYNPERRACAICKYLKKSTYTYYNPNHGGNPGSTDYEVPFYYCEKSEEHKLDKRLKYNCEDFVAKAEGKSSS